MFTQLVPLLEKNDMIFTLSRQKDGGICVTVHPKPREPIGSNGVEGVDIAKKALSTSLQLEGTPSELDEKFVSALVGFVDERKGLESDLSQALENIRQCKEEVKKLEEKERKKLADKKSKIPPTSTDTDSSSEKPIAETKPKDETAELFPTTSLSQPKLVTPITPALVAQ